MKKSRVFIACFGLIASILFVTAATAYSSGYPFAAGLYSQGMNVIVVGKFDSSEFTAQEAENFSQGAADAVGLLGTAGQGLIVLTPSQLASSGLTDADAVKQMVKNIYMQSGFDLYIFLDITKVDSIQPQYGQNVRIDAWVADMAPLLGLTGDYLYVTTLEVPEMYLQLF